MSARRQVWLHLDSSARPADVTALNHRSIVPGITVVQSNAHLRDVTLQDNVLAGRGSGAQLVCDNASTMYVQSATFEAAPGDDTPDIYGDASSTCIVDARTSELDIAGGAGGRVSQRNARTDVADLQLLTAEDGTHQQILRVRAASVAPAARFCTLFLWLVRHAHLRHACSCGPNGGDWFTTAQASSAPRASHWSSSAHLADWSRARLHRMHTLRPPVQEVSGPAESINGPSTRRSNGNRRDGPRNVPPPNDPTDIGAIIGGAVGGGIALAAFAALLTWLLVHRRQRRGGAGAAAPQRKRRKGSTDSRDGAGRRSPAEEGSSGCAQSSGEVNAAALGVAKRPYEESDGDEAGGQHINTELAVRC